MTLESFKMYVLVLYTNPTILKQCHYYLYLINVSLIGIHNINQLTWSCNHLMPPEHAHIFQILVCLPAVKYQETI